MVNAFIIFFSSLRFDILPNGVFISMSAYGVHIITLCPKFPTPELLFYFRTQFENLSCCDTFHSPDDLHWTQCRNTLDQKVDMIFVSVPISMNSISYRFDISRHTSFKLLSTA